MKLAIEGHSTQGSEVIAWLKMLGGMNTFNLNGSETNCYYYIDDNDNIYHCLGIDPRNYIYYTLEEFLEKFPYKVGDKVIDTKTDRVVEIYKAHWSETNNRTYYYVKCFDNTGYIRSHIFLQPYKEETIEEKEPEPKALILSNRYDYAEGKCGYVIPNGYEFDSIKQGFQTEIILRPIKSQYPKTYEECCEIVKVGKEHTLEGEIIRINNYKIDLLESFQKLLICRDAYWKIAGEQIGFDKPWEPDWKNSEEKRYSIVNIEGDINLPEKTLTKWILKVTNKILVFPTEEMRDSFYENFKDLIEECKELL